MTKEPTVPRDLGDGLILRQAMAADTEPLIALHALVLRDPGEQEPDEGVIAWSRDLMERDHPTFEMGDFTVVEDACSGAIVSSLCLISQTWSYGGIPLGVGRPELVATLPEYRRRGLVRAQFDLIHRWGVERGQHVQAITGIPWFYRQFGYEMGLTLGGWRRAYEPQVPQLKKGETEPYRVRPAEEADLPLIAQVYEGASDRYLVACVRDEALWRYELSGRSEKNVNRRELRVVEMAEGEPVGFLAFAPSLWERALALTVYELKPGVSWLAVTPGVMRYLWATGVNLAAQGKKKFGAISFNLGPEHPVYRAISGRLPHARKPYAWYVRVPDLPGFLRHVAPVLERRLAESPLAGHTGELKVSFYQDGLRLALEDGRLNVVEPWQPTVEDDGAASFPGLTFLQLLFGYRTLEELEYAFADCWTKDDAARALLETLFPKQPSLVWAMA